MQLLHSNQTQRSLYSLTPRDNNGMHKQIGYSLAPSHIECALTYPLTPPNKEEMKEMCFEVCLNNLFCTPNKIYEIGNRIEYFEKI